MLYIMSNDIGYIYVLIEREFIKTNEKIYKIGYTKQKKGKRFANYPKNSKILYYSIVINVKKIERMIIDIFKKKFLQQLDIGIEYFKGNSDIMINTVNLIIKLFYLNNDYYENNNILRFNNILLNNKINFNNNNEYILLLESDDKYKIEYIKIDNNEIFKKFKNNEIIYFNNISVNIKNFIINNLYFIKDSYLYGDMYSIINNINDVIYLYYENKINITTDGYGTEYLNNGKKVYEGEFKNYEYNGKGKIYYSNGNLVYDGEFKNGEYNEKGKLYYTNSKLKYEGEFKHNEYNGKGKLYYSNGKLKYEGEFKDNEYNGIGILYDNDGIILYSGQFKHDKYDGIGKIYINGTLYYDGELKNGTKNGFGNEYNIDQSILYSGYFENDYYNGEGTKYSKNGCVEYKGEWYKNWKKNSYICKYIYMRIY